MHAKVIDRDTLANRSSRIRKNLKRKPFLIHHGQYENYELKMQKGIKQSKFTESLDDAFNIK